MSLLKNLSNSSKYLRIFKHSTLSTDHSPSPIPSYWNNSHFNQTIRYLSTQSRTPPNTGRPKYEKSSTNNYKNKSDYSKSKPLYNNSKPERIYHTIDRESFIKSLKTITEAQILSDAINKMDKMKQNSIVIDSLPDLVKMPLVRESLIVQQSIALVICAVKDKDLIFTFYDLMRAQGVIPPISIFRTFISQLIYSKDLKSLAKYKELYFGQGPSSDLHILETEVTILISLNRYQAAHDIVSRITPDLGYAATEGMYNKLITYLYDMQIKPNKSKNDLPVDVPGLDTLPTDKAFKTFDAPTRVYSLILRMLNSGKTIRQSFTERSFSRLIEIYLRENNFQKSNEIMEEVTKRGLTIGTNVIDSLIHIHAEQNNYNLAKSMFDYAYTPTSKKPMNTPTMKAMQPMMMVSFAQSTECGIEFLEYMAQQPTFSLNIRNLNTLIRHFSDKHDFDALRIILHFCYAKKIPVNNVTINYIIRALSASQDPVRVRQVLDSLIEAGIKPDNFIYSSAINAYCSMGLTDLAESLLEELRTLGHQPNVVCYTIVIQAYCDQKRMVEAIRVFYQMRMSRIMPSQATFHVLLVGCYHSLECILMYKLLLEMHEIKISPALHYVTKCIHLLNSQGYNEESKHLSTVLGFNYKTGYQLPVVVRRNKIPPKPIEKKEETPLNLDSCQHDAFEASVKNEDWFGMKPLSTVFTGEVVAPIPVKTNDYENTINLQNMSMKLSTGPTPRGKKNTATITPPLKRGNRRNNFDK